LTGDAIDLKAPKVKVRNVQNDGSFFQLEYIQEDGQKVSAVFKRWMWNKAPAELQAEMDERNRTAFKGGTIATAGPRRWVSSGQCHITLSHVP
jgi:hypothetical protein